MKLTRYIPNFFTLLNLSAGLLALIFVFKQDWMLTAFFVSLGIFFDFFDGLAARSLKASSPVGLQLDSLADMVTSGVVPGFVMTFMLAASLHISLLTDFSFKPDYLLALSGLLITLASAYRLAKFNVDERQTTTFIGLPTPANTLFIVSLPIIANQGDFLQVTNILSNTYVLLSIVIVSAYLLNAEIQLFSLKFKDFSWQDNWQKYTLIIIAIILLPLLKFLAVPIIIILYILLSLLTKQKQ